MDSTKGYYLGQRHNPGARSPTERQAEARLQRINTNACRIAQAEAARETERAKLSFDPTEALEHSDNARLLANWARALAWEAAAR